MFPAQTSFIPITVALAKFIESNGFSSLYPYWYLGTTPVKYLIGPVVPLVLTGLHKVLVNLSLFDLSLLLVVGCQLFLAVGWGFLASRLSGVGKVGFVVGILALILPWRWFSVFGVSEISAVLAQALTPWVLMAFVRSGLRQRQVSEGNSLLFESWLRHVFDWRQAYAFFAFALLLLTNSTSAIPAIVGLLIISISNFKLVAFSDEKQINDKSRTEVANLKKAAIVILFGWLLSLLWYGFDYWLTIWGAPSVGGKSLGGAVVTLLNGLRSILPILLAIVIVYFGTKPKNIYQKFTILWLTVFISITLIRFMADVDFWMDWTSWMGEVEIGLVLLLASLAQSLKFKVQNSKLLEWLPSRNTAIILTLFSIYLVFGWFLAWQKRDFWLPRKNIDSTVEYKIANWLEVNAGQIRGSTPDLGVEPLQDLDKPIVFLSGSTAFWLNSLVDVAQVRGGRDEVSKNGDWRAISWQLTQGENLNDAVRSLKGLGVEYLVVHGDKSGEYYHDFVYPQKFENIPTLEKVYDDMGDVIYRIR